MAVWIRHGPIRISFNYGLSLELCRELVCGTWARDFSQRDASRLDLGLLRDPNLSRVLVRRFYQCVLSTQ